MLPNWWSYVGLVRYMTHYGQELAYLINRSGVYVPVIKGRACNVVLPTIDEATAYVETVIALQRK